MTQLRESTRSGVVRSGTVMTAPVLRRNIVARDVTGKIRLPAASTDMLLGASEQDAAVASECGFIMAPAQVVVTAGAAIANAGVRLTSDSSGRVVAASSGDSVIAVSITTASGADVALEVELVPPGVKLP